MDNNPFRNPQQTTGNSYFDNSFQSQQTTSSQYSNNFQPQYQQPYYQDTINYQQQQQQQWQYQPNQNLLLQQQQPISYPSFNYNTTPSYLTTPNNNTLNYNGISNQINPTYGGYQQYNNLQIPANFGLSTITTTNQPKHAPVDASSLLKGTEIRHVECPVCKKMLEGDDMAINYHVNDHY